MPHETIKLDVDGAVATITLNRPEKLNALSPQLRGELENALAELRPVTGSGWSGYAVRAVASAPATT